MDAAASELPTVGRRSRWSFETVYSLPYDLVFFLAPFWASLIYIALIHIFPARQALIFILSYVVLAETHFGSTWTLYLDAKNRAEYAQRKAVYYWVPLAIMAVCVLVAWSVSLKFVMFAGALFSAVHVVRQSCGMVGLYRARAKQFEPEQKRWENLALYFASATFLAIGFLRFYLDPKGSYAALADRLQPFVPAMRMGTALLAMLAVAAVAQVLFLELKRVQRGGTFSATKLTVFTYSLFLYSPYLFATRMEHAVAIGVGVHYVQYLGLVWLLNRNKYREPNIEAKGISGLGERALVSLSQKLWVRLPYLLFYAGVMTALRQGGFDWDHFSPSSWLYSIPIGLQVIHYHLDAFVWKFSNPYIRSTVAPYLRKLTS